MRKIFILPSIILILIVIIVIEAIILLQRKNASEQTSSSINSVRPNSTQTKVPEQKGRQAVYIAETSGLESATASLVYRGTVLGLSRNDSSQITELTVRVVGVAEDVSFYIDQAAMSKTVIKSSGQEEQSVTYEQMQELIQEGSPIRIVFDYNVLNNTANSIRLEML